MTLSRSTWVFRPLLDGMPELARWAENFPLNPCRAGLSGVTFAASVPTF